MFRTEVIKFLGPWKSVGQVAWETLKRVDWHHTTGLHRAIGCVTPEETEGAVHASLNADGKAASSMKQKPSGKPGACVDAPCLASDIFGLSAGSSIGRVSGL